MSSITPKTECDPLSTVLTKAIVATLNHLPDEYLSSRDILRHAIEGTINTVLPSAPSKEKTREELEVRIAQLERELKSVLPILEAVRFTVGLSRSQLDRIASARAALQGADKQ